MDVEERECPRRSASSSSSAATPMKLSYPKTWPAALRHRPELIENVAFLEGLTGDFPATARPEKDLGLNRASERYAESIIL
jgi:hypothetical protein